MTRSPRRLSTGKIALIVSGAFVLLLVLLVAASPSPLSKSMPSGQAAFCTVASEAARAYEAAKSSGANEIALSQARERRRSAFEASDRTASGSVSDWIGTVEQVKTSMDGAASVEVRIPCDMTVTLKTANNMVSDALMGGTMVKPETQLYAALAKLKSGERVRFSGSLILDKTDHFQEMSVTEAGSMSEPEFLFRFSEMTPWSSR